MATDTPGLPDFHTLERLLASAGIAASAADAHGSFCGLACLLGVEGEIFWLRELSASADAGDVANSACEAQLNALARQSWRSLQAGDMSFSPLLPPDASGLDERAEAMADWCQGFMHGLTLAGGGPAGAAEEIFQDDVLQEILRDFSEITRAAADSPLDDEEEGEAAYAELVEYIRVSTQLVFEGAAGRRDSRPDNK